MIALTLAEIASVIEGQLHLGTLGATELTVITGLTDTDSRMMKPGDIFVAKPGEVTDGHLYAADAVEQARQFWARPGIDAAAVAAELRANRHDRAGAKRVFDAARARVLADNKQGGRRRA